MITTEKNERLLDVFHTHWVKHVFPVAVYLILFSGSMFAFFIAGFSVTHSDPTMLGAFFVGLFLLLLIHHWLFRHLLDESMPQIIITSLRIISLRQRLWLRDDMQEVKLQNIKAISAQKHGILQNLFRYGSLHFDVRAGMGPVIFTLVPHPHRKAKEIMGMLEMK